MCRSYTGAGYPGRRGQVQASARYVRVGTPLAGGGAKWPHPASHWWEVGALGAPQAMPNAELGCLPEVWLNPFEVPTLVMVLLGAHHTHINHFPFLFLRFDLGNTTLHLRPCRNWYVFIFNLCPSRAGIQASPRLTSRIQHLKNEGSVVVSRQG